MLIPTLHRILFGATVAGLLSGSAWSATPQALTAAPLAPRSGTSERMTFTAISASESGLVVANPYDDPAMWDKHYTEFQGGAIGTGIATADVDGDGWVDIYVVNKTRPNQLFRQVAPFKFEDVSAKANVPGGPTWSTGATFADIDNDGDLDLYVCQFAGPNLLYLNDGHGGFTEVGAARGVALESGSVVGAFEDYDRDGDLDLYVVTNILAAAKSPDGEPDYLYRNRGDGTFEEVAVATGIARENGRGHSATWTDLNEDGWPDLYVANDFAVPDHLYRNNGDGTFTDVLAIAAPHTTWFSMGADYGDLNNDGRFDLFVGEMAGTTHYKSKVSMGDMGGLVNHMDTLVMPQYMKNAVFLNTGADRFREIATAAGLGSSDWTWSIRFEDLDNDGWVDLHITNGMVRTFTDSDLLNTVKKMQSPRDAITLMKNAPPMRETNLALRNDRDLHFTKVQDDWGLAHTGVSFGSAFADFDHDGDLDLVYVNFEDTVSLYRNDCPAGHSIVLALKGTASNSQGVGAQAIVRSSQGTQVRKLTVARGALSSSEPVMHFGLGDDAAVASLEVRWPSGHVQRFEHLAANARYTITEPQGRAALPMARLSRPVEQGLFADEAASRGLDFVNTERVFNDMVRQSLLPNRMNTLGGGLAWGDVDGDGDADAYFAGAAGRTGALYLNNGKGSFTRSPNAQPWDAHPEVEEMAPLWFDLDRDGDLDLFVTSGSVEVDQGSELYRSKLYLNNGKSAFTEAPASQMDNANVSSSVVVAGDLDADGDLDLFVGGRVVPGAYPTTPDSRLLENRDGRLVDVTDTVAPGLRQCGMVTAALWTDVDADGRPDLLVTGEWMTVRLYRNNRGMLADATAGTGLDEHHGWWNSLTGADIDQDGDIDYVAGNVGLNTKYRASADHPVQVFFGDFEGSGTCEIVEAEYEGDKLFPVRGRSCSSRAMPSLKDKFPTFHDWGKSLLNEIYSDEKLDQSVRLSVTQLASGVFRNDSHGHFTFAPLPRIAQTSPGFGLAAADLNGDGFVDLFVAQNFNGPQVETGRFDGGISILLLGDGRGSFTAATPAESGIMIPGEGRGVALTDLDRDGRPDLVLTRINENAMALRNRGRAGTRGFAVKLTGARGNADAIGARVTVRYADGRAQAAELYAGAGYLSQSEPLAFFSHPAKAPPKAIDVTWPDGTRKSYGFKPGSAHVVLRQGR